MHPNTTGKGDVNKIAIDCCGLGDGGYGGGVRYRLIVDRHINWANWSERHDQVPHLWPENQPIPEDFEEVVLVGFHTPPAIEEDADGTFKIAESLC